MNIGPVYPHLEPLIQPPAADTIKRDNVRQERIPEPEKSQPGLTDNRQDASATPAPVYTYIGRSKDNSSDTYSPAMLKSNAAATTSSTSVSADAVTAAADQPQGKQQNSSGDNTSSDSKKDGSSSKEQQAIKELKKRDTEVRTHEQAHQAAGGQYASAPSFEMTTGPDGKSYATGGHVNIDVSAVPHDPQATINKMRQIEKAALAPAEPSSQDRKVAAQAERMAMAAHSELQKQVSGNSSTTSGTTNRVGSSDSLQMQHRTTAIAARYLSSDRPQVQTAMSAYA